jgi:endogenous inhibitor of DNA gyrase (YacG/DUF329 family)
MTTILEQKGIKVEHCLICGKKLERERCSSGYYFFDDGRETMNVFPYCSSLCANKRIDNYANPVFQNKKALELFQKKHPKLWRKIKDKPKLFLEKEA